jgi:release factor glutamine methyltransferase
LIPRPETELIVEQALQLPLPAASQVLDLGTGTGAIALALATERPEWQIVGVDVQPQAVELAEHNRQLHQLHNVSILQSDWFSALASAQPSKKFDLIVSNPPYIEAEDNHLLAGDVRFEPASALVAGVDGLDDLRLIIGQSSGFLQQAGWLLVEHGYNQGAPVRDLFVAAGFQSVNTFADYNQLDRITLGCLLGSY